MQHPELQKRIVDFLTGQKLGVIATIHRNRTPEAAVIHFAITENLELIFNTFATYRKYANLQKNTAVAFVFGGVEKITVQYEGVAKELKEQELSTCKSVFLAKYPKAKKWDAYDETRWFLVSPKWIRYVDVRTDNWIKEEMIF